LWTQRKVAEEESAPAGQNEQRRYTPATTLVRGSWRGRAKSVRDRMGGVPSSRSELERMDSKPSDANCTRGGGGGFGGGGCRRENITRERYTRPPSGIMRITAARELYAERISEETLRGPSSCPHGSSRSSSAHQKKKEKKKKKIRKKKRIRRRWGKSVDHTES